MTFRRHLLSVFTAASWAFGAVVPTEKIRSLDPSENCANSPTSRGCWGNDYNISTDFDVDFPTTGKVVSYTLVVTNTTCDPDGSGERICSLVNGQFPGPTIRANWGDTLSITVKNSLQNNGTSIHFHGVRQYHSPGSDGVNGITQCAIAPNDEATYTFQATQYGTGWYHSHTSLQYADGVSGPIVIDGPASANYDIDLGAYMFNEVFNTSTGWQAGIQAQTAIQSRAGPPRGTSLLINGTSTNASGGGSYNRVTIQNGKKYRLRLINSSTNTYVRVSLDGHILKVIAADFVPIQPFSTEYLLLAIGQRYDVVIETITNQTSGAFWFRADVPKLCFSGTIRNGSAIWQYGNSSDDSMIPTSTPWPGETDECIEPTVQPYWDESVPPASFSNVLDANLTTAVSNPDGDSMVVWVLNETIWTNYSDPTIGYIMRNDNDYPTLYNTRTTSQQGSWNYWLILNDPTAFPIPHPIHLHGHDYYIIGNGTGNYDPSTAQLNWENPGRRDTASLPGAGWLAIAWKSNNPGPWLMHCHIAFHIAEGFGIQFLESLDEVTLPDEMAYNQTCQSWRMYEETAIYWNDDSGL